MGGVYWGTGVGYCGVGYCGVRVGYWGTGVGYFGVRVGNVWNGLVLVVGTYWVGEGVWVLGDVVYGGTGSVFGF